MRVDKLMENLSKLEPDQELIVAYWDKSIVAGWQEEEITDDQWVEVVEKYENGEWYWEELAADCFTDLVREVKND